MKNWGINFKNPVADIKYEILFGSHTIWNKALNSILVTLIWNTYSTQSIEIEAAI